MARSKKDGRHHGSHKRSEEFWSRDLGKVKGYKKSRYSKRFVAKRARRQGKVETTTRED